MSSVLSSIALMSVWNTTKVPLHVGYNSPSAPSAHVQLKLHYFFFFFCSESVRKKQWETVHLRLQGVVMVVGRRLNATRFNRAEAKATTG